MNRDRVGLALGLALGALVLAQPAAAQGYAIYEQGTCAMGRGGTGVASASCKDGSAMFLNPAGLAFLEKQTLSVGGTGIAPRNTFTSDATGQKTSMLNKVYPVPHAYYARPLGKSLVAGIGVFAPYGLTTEWPLSFEGRFLGYHSSIQGVYVQPTLAAKLGQRIAVGAGLDITRTSVELRQRLDLSPVPVPGAPPGITFGSLGIRPGTDFGNLTLTGNTFSVGGHFGIQVKLHERFRIGARYLIQQRANVDDGTAEIDQVSTGVVLANGNPFGVPAGTPLDSLLAPQFRSGGTLVDQGGSAAIPYPWQLVVGASFKPVDRLTLLFDFQRTNWAAFDTLAITLEKLGRRTIVESYESTNGYRFGAEYEAGAKTVVRAGYVTHDGAAISTPTFTSVTPSLPEGARAQFTLGLGQQVTDAFRLDMAYMYIDQAARRGKSVEGPPNGLYESYAHLFGATLSFTF